MAVSFENLNVLLIDDERFMRSLVRHALASFDCVQCVEASNGKEALEVIQSHSRKLDLILLDLEMPIMNGFETLKAIRNSSNKKFKEIPVIALTGANDLETVITLAEVGIHGYVLKPVQPQRLAHAITKAFKNGKIDVDALRAKIKENDLD